MTGVQTCALPIYEGGLSKKVISKMRPAHFRVCYCSDGGCGETIGGNYGWMVRYRYGSETDGY